MDLKRDSVEELYRKLVESIEVQEHQNEILQAPFAYADQKRSKLQTIKCQPQSLEDISANCRASELSFLQGSAFDNPFWKLRPPTFSGKVEDFGLFQQKFRDLTASLGFTDAILLEHLLENMTTSDTKTNSPL